MNKVRKMPSINTINKLKITPHFTIYNFRSLQTLWTSQPLQEVGMDTEVDFEQLPQQLLVEDLEQEPQQAAGLESPPQDPQHFEEAWVCKQPLKNKTEDKDNETNKSLRDLVIIV